LQSSTTRKNNASKTGDIGSFLAYEVTALCSTTTEK